MNFFKTLAPVALAAALSLTACTPANTPAPAYTPATVTVPTTPASAAAAPTPAPITTTPAAAPTTPAPAPAAEDAVAAAPAAQCEEDEPCWDCATMGNMICGPVAAAAPVAYAPAPVAPAAVQPPVAKVATTPKPSDGAGVTQIPEDQLVNASKASTPTPDCTDFKQRPYPLQCLTYEARVIFDSGSHAGTFQDIWAANGPITAEQAAAQYKGQFMIIIPSVVTPKYVHVFNFNYLTPAKFAGKKLTPADIDTICNDYAASFKSGPGLDSFDRCESAYAAS